MDELEFVRSFIFYEEDFDNFDILNFNVIFLEELFKCGDLIESDLIS